MLHADWLILDLLSFEEMDRNKGVNFGRATLGAKGRRVRVFTKNSPYKVLYVGGQYQKSYCPRPLCWRAISKKLLPSSFI